MAQEVFPTYAAANQALAFAVGAGLEGQGIRCWVAPSDIPAGSEYGQEIVEVIKGSRVSKRGSRASRVGREFVRTRGPFARRRRSHHCPRGKHGERQFDIRFGKGSSSFSLLPTGSRSHAENASAADVVGWDPFKMIGITLETRDMDRIACVGDLVQRIGDKTRTIGKR